MDKQSRYRELLSQIEVFANTDDNPISVLSNCAAVMKVVFQKEYFWVGFYIVDGDELILGPFQGTPACTRIKFGRGVCGIAWKEGRSLVVEDVEEFPGHIACSSLSRSEIVVPLFSDGVVIGEIDIDSTELATFDDVDREYLEKVAEKNLENVQVTQTGCIGICQYEPVVEIYQPGKEKVTYVKMTAEKAAKVVEEHIVGGKIVTEYTIGAK